MRKTAKSKYHECQPPGQTAGICRYGSGGCIEKADEKSLIAWEGIWYFLLTLALSVAAGSGADFLIFHVIRENMGFGTFHYSILPMVLYMLLSFALCMVIPVAVYKRTGIRSIVDWFRDD